MVNDALTVAKFYNLQGNSAFKQSVMRVGSNSNNAIVDDRDVVLTKPLATILPINPVLKTSGFSAQGFWTGSALLGIGIGIVSHFMPFSDDLRSGSVVFQPLEEYRVLTRNSTFVHAKNSPNSSKTLNLTVQNKKSLSEYQLEATVSKNQSGQSVVSAFKVLSAQESRHFPELPNNKLLIDANKQVTLTMPLDSSKDIQTKGKDFIDTIRHDLQTLSSIDASDSTKPAEEISWQLKLVKSTREELPKLLLLPPNLSHFNHTFDYLLSADGALSIVEKNNELPSPAHLTEDNYGVLANFGKQFIQYYLDERKIDLKTIVERLEHLNLPLAESMVSHKIKMDKSTLAILTVATIVAGIGGLIGGWGSAWLERWQYSNHQHTKPKASNQGKPTETLRQIITE